MTRLHINTIVIGRNATTGSRDPAIKIQRGEGPEEHAHQVEIAGPCRVVYRPDAPLPDGARVWIETDSEVIVLPLDPPPPPSPSPSQ